MLLLLVRAWTKKGSNYRGSVLRSEGLARWSRRGGVWLETSFTGRNENHGPKTLDSFVMRAASSGDTALVVPSRR